MPTGYSHEVAERLSKLSEDQILKRHAVHEVIERQSVN